MLVLEEKLYTSEETAEILGTNPRTLYRYLKKGDIECETKTKSGTFRFTREQIYKYLYPDKYQKILTLLRQKEDTKYPYINNNVLDSVKEGGSAKPVDLQSKEPKNNMLPTGGNEKNTTAPSQNTNQTQQKPENKVVSSAPTNLDTTNKNSNTTQPTDVKPNTTWLKPLQKDSQTGNLYKPLEDKHTDTLGRQSGDMPLHDISKQLDTIPSNPVDTNIKDINIPDPHSDDKPVDTSNASASMPQSAPSSNVDTLPSQNIEAIREQRKNRKLTDELENLESTIDNSSDTPNDSTGGKDFSAVREAEQNWKYFVNTNKDILQLAKEVNSLNAETGRHYAATMKGGLSLHHNIDEFNVVHFYIEEDDLNWWISHLELSICKKEEANICLIPTADMSLFESAYKLRGLYVVSDDRLIQDLMKHGEKELAKSLL